jgi:hypothetical protein
MYINCSPGIWPTFLPHLFFSVQTYSIIGFCVITNKNLCAITAKAGAIPFLLKNDQ